MPDVQRCILTAMMALALAQPALADVAKNLCTGIDDVSGLKLNNGQLDLDYTIAPGSTGGHVGETPAARATPLPNGWLVDSASAASRWVVLNTGIGQEGINAGPGNYIFQMSFSLAGFNEATASIPSARYAADNKLIAVRVNGTPVFTQDSTFAEEFGAFKQLPSNLGVGLFHAGGGNTVSFEVLNQAGFNSPLGLRVEGTVTAQAPEPSTTVSAAAALGGMILGGSARVRRRR
jgi:hypothetical protein